MTSRFITHWKIPNISNLTSRFEYVFFVKDEKTDRTGNARFEALSQDLPAVSAPADEFSISLTKFEKGLKRTAYQVKAPRFVEIKFNQAILARKDSKQFATPEAIKRFINNIFTMNNPSQMINSEETTSSIKDVVLRGTDSNIKERLTSKLDLLLQMNNTEDTNKLKSAKDLGLTDTDFCVRLLGLNSIQGLDVIDEEGRTYQSVVLEDASKATYEMLLDASQSEEVFFSLEERTGFSKLEKDAIGKQLQAAMINRGSDGGSIYDKPVLNCLFYEQASDNIDSFDAYGAKIQGYLIYKREKLFSGETVPKSVDYINADGQSSSLLSYFDTKVVYGSHYEYSVRTLILVKTLYVSSGGAGELEAGKYIAYSLIASKESESSRVQAVEIIPPSEPDGIFYDFLYSKKQGLRIRWQMPPDKQRDVKYFQVFRRKSINEPFTCLAELDFDDSEIRSIKTEMVQIDRVYKTSYPVLTFTDPEFDRGSKYIYAIAAVDAHGMSSGYSEQTEITFNRVENKILRSNVSRAGAPKQYPNIYVRPNLADGTRTSSLTQDAMMFSGAKNLKIYYDPDAASYKSYYNSKISGKIVRTEQENAEYKLHLLNLDRQFDDLIRIRLK
jgi:hypothetical protein